MSVSDCARAAKVALQDLNSLVAEALVRYPGLHDYLGVVKGVRNGVVYGTKIRFPHAVVMSILFGRGECVLCPSPTRDARMFTPMTFITAAGHRGSNTSSAPQRPTLAT